MRDRAWVWSCSEIGTLAVRIIRTGRRRDVTMPVTIKDVAQRANVAPATVSRVLNSSGQVGEATRERVETAVEELQYRPSRTSRSRRTKSSLKIGLAIPDVVNTYFAQVTQDILENLRRRNYDLLVQITNDDPDLELVSLKMLQDGEISGLIYVPVPDNKNSSLVHKMATKGLPMIELSRQREADVLDTVVADNVIGSHMAVERLLQLGHRRIALINSSKDSSTAQERYLGYKNALQDSGLSVDESLVKTKESSKAWGIEATRMLLCVEPRPTAFFVTSNRILVGTLTELLNQKVRVPEDLSIISFDDPEWLSLSQPPITTVGVAVQEMGDLAVQLIVGRIEDPRPRNKPVAYRLSVHLIERQSCACPVE
jgi:LacI family transcriptional regulator